MSYARAKGLRERQVWARHILRVGLLPVITVVALQVGFLLSGTVITETLFVRAGLGRLLLNAILERDLPIVQGVVVLAAISDAGGEGLFNQVDIADSDAVATATAAVAERWDRIDVLVNNAGILRDAQLVKWKNGEVVSTLVYLEDRVDLAATTAQLDTQRASRKMRHEVVVRALQDKAAATQRGLVDHLNALLAQGRIQRFDTFWIGNVIRVDAVEPEIKLIAERPDVDRVYFNYEIEHIDPVAVGYPLLSIVRVHSAGTRSREVDELAHETRRWSSATG